MNEILVEEENTIYELDPECLKRKEEQKKKKETNTYKMQRTKHNKGCNIWLICLIMLIIGQ